MFDDVKTSAGEPEDILARVDAAPKVPTTPPATPRPQTPPATPPVNLPGAVPVTPVAQRPTPPRPPLQAAETAKSGGMVMKIVAGVVAFVVVAGGAAAIWYWFASQNAAPASSLGNFTPANTDELVNRATETIPANTSSNTATNTPPIIPGVLPEGGTVNGLPTESIVEEDTDGDGLTDEEEKGLLTNENKVDTDDDGLTDREEARVYKTDPRNPDSDGDGYPDGVEVQNNFNPRGPGKLFQLQ